MELSDIELEFGPIILKNKPETLKMLLNRRIEMAEKKRDSIVASGSAKSQKMLLGIDESLKKYKEVKRCL